MASEAVADLLKGLDDDLLGYISSVVEDMSENEKKNYVELSQVISPFLIDCGFADEEKSEELCKKIASKYFMIRIILCFNLHSLKFLVAFGGSGYVKGGLTSVDIEEAPELLNAPVRMIDNSGLQPVEATYGGAIISDRNDESVGGGASLHNPLFDIKHVPLTQKVIRRMKKENEQLQRMLKIEAALEAQRRAEMAQVKPFSYYLKTTAIPLLRSFSI